MRRKPFLIVINMQSLRSTAAKSIPKNLISVSDFKAMRETEKSVLTVEISKEPETLLKNSLWIGHRNGGMASWLSALMPHLPHKRFCIYMDKDAYEGSEYMYGYYSEYFSKLFHKQYIGTCVHPRKLVHPRLMTSLNQIKPKQIHEELSCQSNRENHVVFVDLRNPDATKAACLTKEAQKYANVSYLNLPLNDDDLPELLHSKTAHLPPNTKYITLCAKGYRSLIGYSFLKLLKGEQWDIQLCRSPFDEIKKQLSKPLKKQAHASPLIRDYSQLAFV